MTRKTFVTIFALAAVMRLAFVWSAQLWYDENFSYLVSTLPLKDAMQAIIGDVHPPLYYLLIWPLGQIEGLAPWMLRLPSVAFSLVSIWLMWRVMELLYISPRVQIIALVIMAIMPMQLLYAQEVRMYALLEMEVLAAVYFMLKRNWVSFGLAILAMVYTQNYGLFYAPVIYLVGLIHRPRDWQALTLTGIFCALLYLPWWLITLKQMDMIAGHYWLFEVTPGNVFYTFFQLCWGFTFGALQVGAIPVILMTIAWIGAGAAWMVMELIRRRRRINAVTLKGQTFKVLQSLTFEYISILLLAFGPFTLAVIASLVWNPILLFRPLIGITPFLIILLAWPLASLRTTRAQLLGAIFILPMFILSIGAFYGFTDKQKEGAGNRAALAYIVDHWQPGDVLYHASDSTIVNWMPYTPAGLPQAMKLDCEERPYGALTEQTRRAFGLVLAPLDQLPHRRAWVVWADTPLTPACEVDQMQAIIGDVHPVYIIEDTKYIYGAVWLLDAE